MIRTLGFNTHSKADVVPGINPDVQAFSDIDLVLDFSFSLKARFAADEDHFALAMFQAILQASRERLTDPQRKKIAMQLFQYIDVAAADQAAAGLKISFAPGYVGDMADELLDYLHYAGYSQREGFLALLALVRTSFDAVVMNPRDKEDLQATLFASLPTVSLK